MKSIAIYPSLVSGDLLHLADQIKKLEPYCDGFHLDIMDNHFVPNLTWGAQFVNAIARTTTKQLSIHLMIDSPLAFAKTLKLRKSDIVSIHIESKAQLSKFIEFTKEKNLQASLAIKPKTDLTAVFTHAAVIDHVLLMSVEPGFSGQQFLPDSVNRLEKLAAYKKENNLMFTIAMDGGINESNINELAKKGCEQFAIASGIFGKEDCVTALQNLYKK